MRLKDRFKNFRRQPLAARPDSHSPAAEPMRKRPKKSCQWHIAPQLPDGEDELSYQRHVKSMKAEWAKRHPNSSFVEQLMKLTYPQRRQWILAEPRVASVILEECPFLESFEHVSLFISICMVRDYRMHYGLCCQLVAVSSWVVNLDVYWASKKQISSRSCLRSGPKQVPRS